VKPEDIFALHETRKGHIKFLQEGGVELDLRGKKWNEIYTELKHTMEELPV
jgi:hypothetical protein